MGQMMLNDDRLKSADICNTALFAAIVTFFILGVFVASPAMSPPAPKSGGAFKGVSAKQSTPPPRFTAESASGREIRTFFEAIKREDVKTVRQLLNKNGMLANAQWNRDTALC